ncbi:hypothetical protein MMC28_002535 [Mycoblastus sanguinarius]|nr:hypothetical protein [Mycoblastus sanguinarius]
MSRLSRSIPTSAILRPWNNQQLTFATLYQMRKPEIVKFINDVAGKPESFRVEKTYYSDLKKAARSIEDVLSKKRSKFFLDEKDQLQPQALTFEGETINYFSVYDLLGWFMTVIGPSPQDASKENYLLPMGHLFCRWSKEFADGTNPPTMSSIVHVPSASKSLISVDIWDDLTPDVALGSTLPGRSATIRKDCQERRFEQLQHWNFGVEKFPDQRAPGWQRKSQCFGHCAETFPFIMAMILKTKRQIQLQGMTGVALDIGEAETASIQGVGGDSVLSLPSEDLRNPCLNCQYLLQELGAIGKNFEVEGPAEYEPSGTSRTPPATASPPAKKTSLPGTTPIGAPNDLMAPVKSAAGHIIMGALTKPSEKKG